MVSAGARPPHADHQASALECGSSAWSRDQDCQTPLQGLKNPHFLVFVRLSHAYKGRGTDLSGVDAFRRHEGDTGSSEFQIARLSARVTQLTAHLNEHKKDYASRRGLYAVLALRRRLLVYLERTDFPNFQKILQDLHLKPPKHNKTRR